MLNLRERSIYLDIGSTRYLICFEPKSFGRVKNLSVWEAPLGKHIFGRSKAKIKSRNTPPGQAVKELWDSIREDFLKALKIERRNR